MSKHLYESRLAVPGLHDMTTIWLVIGNRDVSALRLRRPVLRVNVRWHAESWLQLSARLQIGWVSLDF
jgi:hypothetical protein